MSSNELQQEGTPEGVLNNPMVGLEVTSVPNNMNNMLSAAHVQLALAREQESLRVRDVLMGDDHQPRPEGGETIPVGASSPPVHIVDIGGNVTIPIGQPQPADNKASARPNQVRVPGGPSFELQPANCLSYLGKCFEKLAFATRNCVDCHPVLVLLQCVIALLLVALGFSIYLLVK